MSFLSRLFGKGKVRSIALIDIAADSVGGAYVTYPANEAPLIIYTKRVPIEERTEEHALEGMKVALDTLGASLVREGAPLLLRTTGTGRVDDILVSIDSPWQGTQIRTEKIQRERPFIFTKAMIQAVLAKSAEEPPGRILADESIVGTELDGYETKNPVGKRASRANIVVLASFVDRLAGKMILDALRAVFHTKEMNVVAAASLRYQALHAIFPHEENYLVIDAAKHSIITTLVRRKLLYDVEHSPIEKPEKGKDEWLAALQKNFEAMTKRFPLPRTFLLIAPESERAVLKTKIEGAPFQGLRLSEEEPMVIPVSPSHLSDHIKLSSDAVTDLPLELMAIYWQQPEW